MKKKLKKSVNKNRKPSTNDISSESSADKPKKRTASVDYEAFVRLWMKASSINEVADAFNIKTSSASAIANRIRKAGVPDLKRFPRRGVRVIDVKKLSRIVAGKD